MAALPSGVLVVDDGHIFNVRLAGGTVVVDRAWRDEEDGTVTDVDVAAIMLDPAAARRLGEALTAAAAAA